MTGGSGQGGERQEALIAGRLQRLFDEVQPKGRRFKQSEVVDAVNAAAGERLLSRQYMSELLRGDKDRPSFEILTGIARFFGVPPAYFTGDDTSAAEELEVAEAMRRAGIRELALRANGMSDQTLASLRGVIDRILEIEARDREADGPADPSRE